MIQTSGFRFLASRCPTPNPNPNPNTDPSKKLGGELSLSHSFENYIVPQREYFMSDLFIDHLLTTGVKLGTVMLLGFERHPIPIFPQHANHTHSYIRSSENMPIHRLFSHWLYIKLKYKTSITFALYHVELKHNYRRICLGSKEAVWDCRNMIH